MTLEVTRGAVAVRDAVQDHLEFTVPILIDQARNSWGIGSETLPYPKRYDAWDPWETQEYPVVGAYVLRSRNFSRLNNGNLRTQYRPLYSLNVAVWAEDTRFDGVKFKDPKPMGATRVANDLTAVLRIALLEFPNLNQPDIFSIEEDTYEEEYIPAQKSMGEESWVAGGLLSFSMHVNESNLLQGSSVGLVENVALSVYNVGPSQEFEE